jgi:hypothetical protein
MAEEENPLELPGDEIKLKKQRKKTISLPVEISLAGLRTALFNELNLLRGGKISVSRARVTSQLARRIIETVTLDLCAQNLLGNGTQKDLKRLTNNNVQG